MLLEKRKLRIIKENTGMLQVHLTILTVSKIFLGSGRDLRKGHLVTYKNPLNYFKGPEKGYNVENCNYQKISTFKFCKKLPNRVGTMP